MHSAAVVKALEDRGIDAADLDMAVHKLKSWEATDINNGGLHSQVEYLLRGQTLEASEVINFLLTLAG